MSDKRSLLSSPIEAETTSGVLTAFRKIRLGSGSARKIERQLSGREHVDAVNRCGSVESSHPTKPHWERPLLVAAVVRETGADRQQSV